jgi:hypothetical protein
MFGLLACRRPQDNHATAAAGYVATSSLRADKAIARLRIAHQNIAGALDLGVFVLVSVTIEGGRNLVLAKTTSTQQFKLAGTSPILYVTPIALGPTGIWRAAVAKVKGIRPAETACFERAMVSHLTTVWS